MGAYLFLLTDRYPPFSFDDVEYPVRPILPDRGPLNRVSVFFRIILAIPAVVFSQIVLNGLTFPLLFVMWIVVLVTGSMPASLYDTYAALLRYQVRFHSWFAMITSEYAWGMLGDTSRRPRRPRRRPSCLPALGRLPPGLRAPGPAAGPAAGATAGPPPAPGSRRRSPTPTRATGEQAATPPADAAAAAAAPPVWPPPQPRPHRSPPGPCPRPHRGSAPRRRPRLIRCPPGGSSSCRVRPGPG